MRAQKRFETLVKFGKAHLNDKVSIDYFAVSLPDFLVFEDDLNRRNKVHCFYMMGLGHLGLQEFEKARSLFSRVLELDVNHQGARTHLEMDSVKRFP